MVGVNKNNCKTPAFISTVEEAGGTLRTRKGTGSWEFIYHGRNMPLHQLCADLSGTAVCRTIVMSYSRFLSQRTLPLAMVPRIS